MMKMVEFFWVYFGVFAVLLMALQELAKSRRTNWNFIILLITIASHIVRLGLILQGAPRENIYLLFGTATLLVLMCSTMLRITYRLLDLHFKTRLISALHELPTAVVLLGEIILFGFFPDTLSEGFKRYFDGGPLAYEAFVLLILGLNVATYTTAIFSYFIRVARRHGLPYAKMVVVVTIIPLLNIIAIIAYFFRSFGVLKVIAYSSPIGIIIAFVLQARYPKFFSQLALEVRKGRYATTPIDHLDIETLRGKIDELVLEQNIYKDPDLNLNKLAAKLSLTGHQMSRVLNEVLRKSFYEFINEYRVKEATRLLQSDEDNKIIDICYQVGFNSLSVFNAQFRKYTGYTPKELKRRKKIDSPTAR